MKWLIVAAAWTFAGIGIYAMLIASRVLVRPRRLTLLATYRLSILLLGGACAVLAVALCEALRRI